MNKILALYRNELYKTLRKVSIIVFAILIVVSGILTPAVFRLLDNTVQSFSYSFYSDEDYWQEEINYYEAQIQYTNEQLDLALQEEAPASQISSYSADIINYEHSISTIKFRIDNNFVRYSDNGFVNYAFQTIDGIRSSQRMLNSIPEDSRSSEWNTLYSTLGSAADDLFEIIVSKDFSAYIDFCKDLMNAPYFSNFIDSNMTNEIAFLELWYKIDPSGGLDSNVDYYSTQSTVQYYLSQKEALETGFIVEYGIWGESSAVPLSPDKEDEIKNNLAIMDYKIDNKQLNLSSSEDLSTFSHTATIGLGLFFVTILAFIIAGSSVSQELATGSIKSLIIAPVRRWKIFTAKYLSLLTVTILGVFMVWVFSNIGNTLFFGSTSMPPYLYAVDGVVKSIPFAVFDLLKLFASCVNIFVLMTFAFMLSIITKNTAISVGTALAASFVITPIVTFIVQLGLLYRSWMDFLPFMNFDIASQLFPFEKFLFPLSFAEAFSAASAKGPSLMFSVIYLILLLFCMMYIGFDSFTRRDIK